MLSFITTIRSLQLANNHKRILGCLLLNVLLVDHFHVPIDQNHGKELNVLLPTFSHQPALLVKTLYNGVKLRDTAAGVIRHKVVESKHPIVVLHVMSLFMQKVSQDGMIPMVHCDQNKWTSSIQSFRCSNSENFWDFKG